MKINIGDFAMKALRILSTFLIAVILLSASVAAADFTPSVEVKPAPEVVTVTDDAGNPAAGVITAEDGTVSYITVEDIAVTAKADASDTVLEVIEAAADELAATELSDLIPDFADAWADVTGGAPVENAVVADVFDISADVEIPAGGKLTITLAPQGITEDDIIIVLHKVGDTWKVEPHTRDGKGNIVTTVTSLSPFAIVKDSAAAPAADAEDPRSPQTSEPTIAPVAVLCIVAVLSTAFFVRASKRITVK